MPVRIIGVGSPAGDDQVGWQVITAIERSSAFKRDFAPRVSIMALDRPGAGLFNHIAGAQRVLLIDAMHSGAYPGTIHRLQGAKLEHFNGTLSSHSFGLAQALALARVLGALPADLTLYGIEIEAAMPGGEVTPPVHTAALLAAQMILNECSPLSGAGMLPLPKPKSFTGNFS